MRSWISAVGALALGGQLIACITEPNDDPPPAVDTAAQALIGYASPLADYEMASVATATRVVATNNYDSSRSGWSGFAILPKTSGDLGLTVDPAAFGITGQSPVYLAGTDLGGDVVRLTATVVPPPGRTTLRYDGQTSIYRLAVDLQVRAEWIPPEQQADCRTRGCLNTRLIVLPASRITAHIGYEVIPGVGSTEIIRDVAFSINAFDGTSGLPHAYATRLALNSASGSAPPGRYRVCSSTRARSVYGSIAIDVPARENGVSVPLVSSNATIIAYPGWIPRGARTGGFQLALPAGFVGSTHIITNDGTWRSIDLDVTTCAVNSNPFPVTPLTTRPDLTIIPRPGCLACLVGDINSRGEAAVLVATGPIAYDPSLGSWKPLTVPAGTTINRLLIDDLGHVVMGGTNALGKLTTLAATPTGTSWDVTELGSFEPRAVAGPLVVGGTVNATPAWAMTFGLVRSVPAVAALLGPIVAIVDERIAIDVAGTDILFDPATSTSKLLGTASEKVAVIGSDDAQLLIGTFTDSTGRRQAFSHDTATGVRTALGFLPGATDSTPTSINRNGWVVGTSGGTAFLYRPGVGIAKLTSSIDPNAGLAIEDVMRITDGGQALVAGRVNGVLGFHLIAVGK